MSVEGLNQIWPEWQVEGKPLGRGSFGVVYKAVRRDHNIESYAAIKVISIPADPSEVDSLRSEGMDMNATRTYLQGIVEDFVKEIKLMEDLKGVQNIVSVEDYEVVEKTGEIGWTIYIRMELLTSFNTYICDKKLTEEEVIKLGCDICTALEICAKRNIIHRDIKPENIFINDFGDFKLGDFGIARKIENLTGGLSQKGSPNYMAPEVAKGNDYDARVDTYSLGIVLYRLLNGNRLPFLDSEKQLLNPNERRNALDRRLRGEKLPAPCDASPAMADLILRACAYEPNKRFTSATEMKQALLRVATNDLGGTRRVRKAQANRNKATSAASNRKTASTVGTFGSLSKEKSKLYAVIAAVLVVVLLAGVGFFAIPKLFDRNNSDDPNETSSETTAETANYSKLDEEQIASIISEADALASGGDYESALVKVQTGLMTYPKSAKLQKKANEYTKALNDQVKEKTLDEAKALVDSGDYVSAIVLLKNAQETQGEDADYQNALDTYSSTYKADAIAAADGLASGGDYIGAITKIKEAEAVLGEDPDLTNKAQTYEDEYVNGIVSQVDAYIKAKDYNTATTAVNEALKVFPENEILIERRTALKNSNPKSLLSVCPPYQTAGYYAGKTYSMAGNVYANGFHLDDNNGGVAYFNLRQEYSLLSFDIGHRDGQDSKTGYYYFYLDGELIKTLTLDPSMPIQHIDIPVEDVSQLVIQGGNWCQSFAFVNTTLTPNILYKPDTDSQEATDTDGRYILNACPPNQTKGYYAEKTYSLAGDTYINGFHLNDDYGGIAYYSLDGQYNTLSFDVGHIDGKDLKTGFYYFYLDGELVYTLELDPSMLVQHVKIPLNSATQMVIEGGPWCHCFALVNVKVSE